MSPQAKTVESTDATGNAQGRFTVQLPADLRPMLADLGAAATRKVKEDVGIDVELSMAQIVTGIVKAQHAVQAKRHAEAASDGAANHEAS